MSPPQLSIFCGRWSRKLVLVLLHKIKCTHLNSISYTCFIVNTHERCNCSHCTFQVFQNVFVEKKQYIRIALFWQQFKGAVSYFTHIFFSFFLAFLQTSYGFSLIKAYKLHYFYLILYLETYIEGAILDSKLENVGPTLSSLLCAEAYA